MSLDCSMRAASIGTLALLVSFGSIPRFATAAPSFQNAASPAASSAPSPAPAAAPAPLSDWTILLYAAVDNSAEESFMGDLALLRAAMADDAGVAVALLIDRSPAHDADATVLCEEFADTRLYRITHAAATRLDGGPELPQITRDSKWEGNTGDPALLRGFLRFGKRAFPAKRTALVFYTHGSGHSLAVDESDGGDVLWTTEMSAALEERDSVDLLGFDVCLMGGVENAYEWRRRPGAFGADFMVASAPSTAPWPYHRIFGRLRNGASALDLHALPEGRVDVAQPALRAPLDPAAMDARAFGRLIVEELDVHRAWRVAKRPGSMAGESWASCDLAQAAELKQAIDALAVELAAGGDVAKQRVAAIRGSGTAKATLRYFDGSPAAWRAQPFFDVFDLAVRIGEDDALAQPIRDAADRVSDAADAVVDASFGREAYPGFEPGRHGLFVTFPDGDATPWAGFRWYGPDRLANAKEGFGGWASSRDGATRGDEKVENWFELLDAWFDRGDRKSGGVNGIGW